MQVFPEKLPVTSTTRLTLGSSPVPKGEASKKQVTQDKAQRLWGCVGSSGGSKMWGELKGVAKSWRSHVRVF